LVRVKISAGEQTDSQKQTLKTSKSDFYVTNQDKFNQFLKQKCGSSFNVLLSRSTK